VRRFQLPIASLARHTNPPQAGVCRASYRASEASHVVTGSRSSNPILPNNTRITCMHDLNVYTVSHGWGGFVFCRSDSVWDARSLLPGPTSSSHNQERSGRVGSEARGRVDAPGDSSWRASRVRARPLTLLPMHAELSPGLGGSLSWELTLDTRAYMHLPSHVATATTTIDRVHSSLTCPTTPTPCCLALQKGYQQRARTDHAAVEEVRFHTIVTPPASLPFALSSSNHRHQCAPHGSHRFSASIFHTPSRDLC
jgi:hypothetical protein